MNDPDEEQLPIKDEDAAHPIAHVWRPVLRAVVSAFVRGDYSLGEGVRFVAPVALATADHIRSYVEEYCETLTELPDETWVTSVAQWMGSRWDVLVDLWTLESGASDLVLHARIFEDGSDFRIEIDSVYVP